MQTFPESPLKSVSRILFGPADVLFAADWKASKVHAFQLPAPAGELDGKYFNIKDLEAQIRQGADLGEIALEDITARPGSNEVYVSVSIGVQKEPAIFVATADGAVRRLPLESLASTSAELDAPPDDMAMFWRTIPVRSFTVTDMAWRDGKLYAAGVSNQAFASTLRVLPYPFGSGTNTVTSVEIYHAAHGQVETRAPMRAMTFIDIDGEPHMLCGYLCTPIVTIPLKQIEDGAHITGKTIMELAVGGYPVALIPIAIENFQTGEAESNVLAINRWRHSFSISMASIKKAHAAGGLSVPTKDGSKIVISGGEGLEGISELNVATVFAASDQGGELVVALRRDLQTGRVEVVSYNKSGMIRLSDMDVEEYWWRDWQPRTPQDSWISGTFNYARLNEGYPDLVQEYEQPAGGDMPGGDMPGADVTAK